MKVVKKADERINLIIHQHTPYILTGTFILKIFVSTNIADKDLNLRIVRDKEIV